MKVGFHGPEASKNRGSKALGHFDCAFRLASRTYFVRSFIHAYRHYA
jgi:hypothetical protein